MMFHFESHWCDSFLTSLVIGISWILVLWPLWDRIFTTHNCSPLVMFPYIINVIGLLPPAYEEKAQNFMSGVWSSIAPFLLAFATLVELGQVTWENLTICGSLSLLLVINSVRLHRKKILIKITNKATITKAVMVSGLALLLAWLIPLYLGITPENLLIGFLMGGAVVGGTLASMLSCEECAMLGLGLPLMWTSLRVLCTPGVVGFWIWALYSMVSVLVFNLFGDMTLTRSLRNHWKYWKTLGNTASPWLLGCSLMVLIFSASGTLVETRMTITSQMGLRLSLPAVAESMNASDAEVRFLEGLNPFPGLIHQHNIFESPTCVVNAVLLIANACIIYVHDLNQKPISGSMWQAIFFCLVGLTALYYERDEQEFRLESVGLMSFSWSREAVVFFVLCGVGTVISLMSAMSVSSMTKRVYTNYKFLLPFSGLVILVLLLVTRMLAAWPEGTLSILLPHIPRTCVEYDSFVNPPNKCLSVMVNLVQITNVEYVTSISALLFTELAIMLTSLVASAFILGGAIWFPFLNDILVLALSLNGLLFTVAITNRLTGLKKIGYSGTVYEPFTTTLVAVLVMAIAAGIASRIRRDKDSLPYEWRTFEWFSRDYDLTNCENLKCFVQQKINVDISEMDPPSNDPETVYKWILVRQSGIAYRQSLSEDSNTSTVHELTGKKIMTNMPEDDENEMTG